MKKDELKRAFENNFKNIEVSEELKNKTLKSINESIKKTSHIHYIRNFAAIFVVTLLCTSIYFTHNLHPKTQIPNNYDLNTQIHNDQNSKIKKEETLRSSDAISTPLSISYDIYETKNNLNQGLLESSSKKDSEIMFQNSSHYEETSISEDDFIISHPEAKKIENGYILYENNKEILYVFKDGILENIIIIE